MVSQQAIALWILIGLPALGIVVLSLLTANDYWWHIGKK
jgi:hypothetical protein